MHFVRPDSIAQWEVPSLAFICEYHNPDRSLSSPANPYTTIPIMDPFRPPSDTGLVTESADHTRQTTSTPGGEDITWTTDPDLNAISDPLVGGIDSADVFSGASSEAGGSDTAVVHNSSTAQPLTQEALAMAAYQRFQKIDHMLDELNNQVTYATHELSSPTVINDNSDGLRTRPDPQHVDLFDQFQSNLATVQRYLREAYGADTARYSIGDSGDGRMPTTLSAVYSTAQDRLNSELNSFREVATPYPYIESHLSNLRNATIEVNNQANGLLSSILCNRPDKTASIEAYVKAYRDCETLANEAKRLMGTMIGMAKQVSEETRPIHSLMNELTKWRKNLDRTRHLLDIAMSRD
ncbi:hypothetical protein IAT40_006498 [Kwoniella sp. CBS 6097]